MQIEPEHKLLSYATRGMEPVRGFPQFMPALPELLANDPQLQVVIAGRDRCAYSYAAPRTDGIWKQYCLHQLGECPGRDRIHFTGLLTYEQYRQLLWRTDAHCSFSRPYLLRWSLFEALACATPLVVNESPAYRSAVPKQAAAVWVDLDDPQSISQGIHARLNATTPSGGSSLKAAFSHEEYVTGWNAVINELSG